MPLAVRIVLADYTSPYARYRGTAIATRPGETIEADGMGLFAYPADEADKACNEVLNADLLGQFRTAPRVLLLAFDDQDAREVFALLIPWREHRAGRTELRFGRREIVLSRARVVRELTPDEIRAVAEGAPLDTLDGLAA